jgi:hypothetical protein
VGSITPVPGFLRAERYGAWDFFLDETDIPMRLMTEITVEHVNTVKRWLSSTGTRIQYRHKPVISQHLPRFFIKDTDEVLLFLKTFNPNPRHGLKLWSNSDEVVNAFRVLFDEFWHTAVVAEERIAELETAQPEGGA